MKQPRPCDQLCDVNINIGNEQGTGSNGIHTVGYRRVVSTAVKIKNNPILIDIPCDDFETYKIPTIEGLQSNTCKSYNCFGCDLRNLVHIKTPASIPSVKIGLINCRSACNKADYISDYILEKDLDCVALTETWLHGNELDNITIQSLVTKENKMSHAPRSGTREGGVDFFYKEQFDTELHTTHTYKSFELM